MVDTDTAGDLGADETSITSTVMGMSIITRVCFMLVCRLDQGARQRFLETAAGLGGAGNDVN